MQCLIWQNLNLFQMLLNSKSNNKYLKSYDPRQVYGYAMSNFLATNGFKWLLKTSIQLNRVAIVPKDLF